MLQSLLIIPKVKEIITTTAMSPAEAERGFHCIHINHRRVKSNLKVDHVSGVMTISPAGRADGDKVLWVRSWLNHSHIGLQPQRSLTWPSVTTLLLPPPSLATTTLFPISLMLSFQECCIHGNIEHSIFF